MTLTMKCLTCGSKSGYYADPDADVQWWTCARCGDEWMVPDDDEGDEDDS